MILKLELTGIKRFNAFQNNFESQWSNGKPCKNLRLKLSNQLLRTKIGLCLGSKNCEKHRCEVTEDR